MIQNKRTWPLLIIACFLLGTCSFVIVSRIGQDRPVKVALFTNRPSWINLDETGKVPGIGQAFVIEDPRHCKSLWDSLTTDINMPPDNPNLVLSAPVCHTLVFFFDNFGPNCVQIPVRGNFLLEHNEFGYRGEYTIRELRQLAEGNAFKVSSVTLLTNEMSERLVRPFDFTSPVE